MYSDFFRGKRIAIFNSMGEPGSSIIEALLELPILELRLLGNDQTTLFKQALGINHKLLTTAGVNELSQSSVEHGVSGIDYLFYLSPFKHISQSETQPLHTVEGLIGGVSNIIAAASSSGIKKVMLLSSDKAVNPTSVMGISMLLSERLIVSAAVAKPKTIFSVVRNGSILGMEGSISDIYLNCLKNGEDLPLTHRSMTRFFTPPTEAANFIFDSMQSAKGGEIFIKKMKAAKIEDFANMMGGAYQKITGNKPKNTTVRLIGIRTGEKIYEELVSIEEIARTLITDDSFIVMPEKLAEAEKQSGNKLEGYKSSGGPFLAISEGSAILAETKFLQNSLISE